MAEMSEHLEHIEHSKHAAHDHFDRNVAMTMAIVAAILAAITLLSHRGHNETLQLQLDASLQKTNAADQWAYYQAKNIRQHEYEADLVLAAGMAKESDPARKAEYEKGVKKWHEQLAKYEKDLPDLEKEAKGLDRKALELRQESHHAHQRATRYDLGELFVELALVLCSVAILTKKRVFWFSGIASCFVGVVIASSVLWYLHYDTEGGHEPPPGQGASAEGGTH